MGLFISKFITCITATDSSSNPKRVLKLHKNKSKNQKILESVQKTQATREKFETRDIQMMTTLKSNSLTFLLEDDEVPAMPEKFVLDELFQDYLDELDLSDIKLQIFKEFEDEKKWEILCASRFVKVQHSPSYFVKNLRNFQEFSFFKPRLTFTKLLKGLELSLRTNHVTWMNEFLKQDFESLNILARIFEQNLSEDNLYTSLLCIKQILNSNDGIFAMAKNQQLVNAIAVNIKSPLRTKCLVCQLLTQLCSQMNGHDAVVEAFQYLKRKWLENQRFQTLVESLMNERHDQHNLIVLQLINSIIFSTNNNLNYQVHLQFEFQQLGLNDHLDDAMKYKSKIGPAFLKEMELFKEKSINVKELVTKIDSKKKECESEVCINFLDIKFLT